MRCDEGFAELKDLEGASPLLRGERWVVGGVVSNKKDKHALAASDKRPIRFDLTRHYVIAALCGQSQYHIPHTCLPSPTLSSFPHL